MMPGEDAGALGGRGEVDGVGDAGDNVDDEGGEAEGEEGDPVGEGKAGGLIVEGNDCFGS